MNEVKEVQRQNWKILLHSVLPQQIKIESVDHDDCVMKKKPHLHMDNKNKLHIWSFLTLIQHNAWKS